MERKSTQGYFISDEELLAALEYSEFEFDDLDNDPNFVPNDESDDDEKQDKGETTGAEGDQTENQMGNIRPTTTETGTSFESENEDLGLDLDLSAAGPSRQPANVGLTLRDCGPQHTTTKIDLTQDTPKLHRKWPQMFKCHVCKKVLITQKSLNYHLNTQRSRGSLPYHGPRWPPSARFLELVLNRIATLSYSVLAVWAMYKREWVPGCEH
ncbi:hypothetical protein J6590_096445 [Homalodisca vitripennis]|nr:hypothetical protein J6590_096445 [Homalodisca vitripennis]